MTFELLDTNHTGLDLSNLLMQVPVAIGVLKGKEMMIEFANPGLQELWGKGEEVIGKPLIEAIPELIGQPFPDLLLQVYQTGIPHHGTETLAYIVRNGVREQCYFNFVYAPLKDRDGIIVGVTIVANEVTQQVQAKIELELSEKKFRNLVHEAEVATGIYMGEEMRIELANDAMIKLWGKDRSVIGKTIREALPELEGQPFHKLLDDVYHTGVTYRATEDRADLVVDGLLQTYYFNFTYKALRDAAGRIIGILNQAVDVTEIVRSRSIVKESEAYFRDMADHVPVMIWKTDRDGVCTYVNRQWTEYTGQTPEEACGTGWIDPVHPDDRDGAAYIFAKAIETNSPFSIEYRLKATDGSYLWMIDSGVPRMNEHGEPDGFMGAVIEIDQQKRMFSEMELLVRARTKDLEEANAGLLHTNKELEQFAFVTSHDLQEPLRKIRTFTSMLMEKNSELLNDKGQVYIDKIISSAKRMSELINGLLNFSRLQRSDEGFVPVDLNEVLNNVKVDFEVAIHQKDAIITCDELPVIEAKPIQMNQLFFNLLGNALKFTKPGVAPVINITAGTPSDEKLAALGLDNNLPYVEIKISDNGIGFDQQYAVKIFEIFQRLNDRSEHEGTGIGLAVCSKIVANHKGAIEAFSSEGKGSSFHVILPVQQPVHGS